MLTIQEWLDAGYKQYNQKTYNLADYLLQKRIDDEQGKKYFIDIWVYEHFNKPYFANNLFIQKIAYQPECQFRASSEGLMTVNAKLIMNNKSTIMDVEQEFEKMWVFFGEHYYSKWDE